MLLLTHDNVSVDAAARKKDEGSIEERPSIQGCSWIYLFAVNCAPKKTWELPDKLYHVLTIEVCVLHVG